MISRKALADLVRTAVAFQSRNRGSFDFKGGKLPLTYTLTSFQSRNRGSFDFKLVKVPVETVEMLNVSIS